jgi:spermidine/putrescine-binding protein
MNTKISRPTSLIKTLLATLAVAASFGAQAQEEKVLNIYNWADYIAEDTIKNFEKETGITPSWSRASRAMTSWCPARTSPSSRSRPAC